MKEAFAGILISVGLALGVLVVFATLPTQVFISHSTGECVKVLHPDGTEGDCAQLPSRYKVVHVQ